jgi:hypothetical protein
MAMNRYMGTQGELGELDDGSVVERGRVGKMSSGLQRHGKRRKGRRIGSSDKGKTSYFF